MRDENKLYEIIGRQHVENMELADDKKYWFNRCMDAEKKANTPIANAPIKGIIQEDK